MPVLVVAQSDTCLFKILTDALQCKCSWWGMAACGGRAACTVLQSRE